MSKSFPENPTVFRSSSESDLEKPFQKEGVFSKIILRTRKN